MILKNFWRNIFRQLTKFFPTIKFPPQVLKSATHFITTREMVTLEWLYGADVKIISALDEEIFE